jgi:5,10-methylene-tetrahydrofolate dehydrogenase/methenyl tetrahydrofolate cyclohydrolase
MAKILDGKKVASEIYNELQHDITLLKQNNITPGLSVILVGDRTDSKTYVAMKQKKCRELGIFSKLIKLEEDVSEDKIIKIIRDLNNDDKINGILIQLPLPKHLNENTILSSVKLSKDVDGFHFENIGRLSVDKQPLFVPCTPKGCLEILDRYKIDLCGKNICILGRSAIVGLPLSLLLLYRNATITICHSKTENISEITKQADILIAACGRTEMVKKDWIKDNCIIIDIGINSKPDTSRKLGYRLVGDVDFNDVKEKVKYITPVPGGVGPMTIAMLMKQTIESTKRENEL